MIYISIEEAMRTKPATQKRSQDKLVRILAAMDALLGRKQFEEITIGEIAAAADVSAATIYQRFRNEDAAGAILLELYLQRVREWAMRGPPAKPAKNLRGALLQVGRDAWDQAEALGHVMRPAYLYSRRYPDRAGADWEKTAELAEQGFSRFVERFRAEVARKDLDEAAATVGFVVNLMLVGLLLHGETRPPFPLRSRERFAATLADLVCAYLASSGKAGQ